MKKLFSVMLACALVFTLAACSSGKNNSGSESSQSPSSSSPSAQTGGDSSGDAKENITLRIAWWGGQPRHDYTLEVIELYESQNPHVKIEPEYAAWDDYWTKLAPMAAGNELPDILQMDLSYIAQYGENQQLEDLTPYIGNEIDVSNIAQSVIDGGKLGDQIYGFNLGVNALGFQFDPALLEKATGSRTLPENWTWDDYIALTEQAKAAGLYFDTGMRAEVFFAYTSERKVRACSAQTARR